MQQTTRHPSRLAQLLRRRTRILLAALSTVALAGAIQVEPDSPAETDSTTAPQSGPASRPLLRILETAGTQTPAPPPAIDLRRLEVDVQEFDRGQGPEPFMTIELETAGRDEGFPDESRYSVHIDFGREAPPSATETPSAVTLTMQMTDRSSAGGRRRSGGGSRGSVPRFSGPADIGPLSSVDPGRQITFRLPVETLVSLARQEDRAASVGDDGLWWLRIRAESAWTEAVDRLPRGDTPPLPTATFQIPVGENSP